MFFSKIKKNLIISGILLLLIILLRLAWHFVPAFRGWYAYKWYPSFSVFQRAIFGYIPFSFGEIIYTIMFLLLLLWIALIIINIWHLKKNANYLLILLTRAAMAVLFLYFLFLTCWGFNYGVQRVQQAFNIKLHSYSVAGLDSLCVYLVQEVNSSHQKITHNNTDSVTFHFTPANLFKTAIAYYKKADQINPALYYHVPSVKSSMFGYLLNYAGVEGYYNPFTGEAQVNTTMPALSQPYVACHEMAHQIGFAPEYSASFTGYFVAMQSGDPKFIYSANFEVLEYAIGELSFRDSAAAKNIWNNIAPGVKKDYQAEENFYRRFNNPVNPIMADLYDTYLKANRQKRGIRSYNQVVALLIDYRKKK